MSEIYNQTEIGDVYSIVRGSHCLAEDMTTVYFSIGEYHTVLSIYRKDKTVKVRQHSGTSSPKSLYITLKSTPAGKSSLAVLGVFGCIKPRDGTSTSLSHSALVCSLLRYTSCLLLLLLKHNSFQGALSSPKMAIKTKIR